MPAPPIAPMAQPVPQQGVAGLLQTLTPEEKQLLLQQTLGSAAGSLGALLAARPNISTGAALAVAAGGAAGGRLGGLRGIQLGRTMDERTAVYQATADRQKLLAQAELAKQQRRAAILAGMPPEMRALAQASEAGVPSAVLGKLIPGQPGKPQIFGSPQTGYWTLGPDGEPRRLVGAAPRGAAGGRRQIFGSSESGYYEAQPGGDISKLIEGTAAQENTPMGLYRSLFEKILPSTFGDAKRASDQALAGTKTMYPGFELPAQPQPPAPAPQEGSASWWQMFSALGRRLTGGDEPPADTTMLTTQQQSATPAPGATAGAPPINANTTASDLRPGQVYMLPDGRRGRWDGEAFEVE